MRESRSTLDSLLRGDTAAEQPLRVAGLEAGAAGAMAEELQRTPLWLSHSVEPSH